MRLLYMPTMLVCFTVLLSARQAQTTNTTPDGVIDGPKNPDLIPDAVAFRLFFAAVAEPPAATAEQLKRQHEKLRYASLQDSDIAIVSDVLSTFHSRFNSGSAVLTPNALPEDIQAAYLVREKVVSDTRDELKRRLAPTSLTNLEQYIKSRKVNMKMYPEPQM